MLDADAQDSSGSPLEIGQIIAGKYRIERQIGRGGMGVVLAATHLQLETLVAIKVMRRDLLEDDRALNRLLVEARSAAKIRSEHVARVLDVGTLEGGVPFIVMEYLEGEDLADLLDKHGALEIEQAVGFLLECCEALAEVHVAEMVHRDLKPGNLFIARLPDGSPTVKIVDFGISKQIGGPARERAATTSPQVLGSPFYMAPEQMRAESVDERSDIWALGAILFEMLTGRPPFVAETLPEVYAAVLGQAPPPIDELRPSAPPGLDDVVQRCLDKDPAQRFCDVADLAEALAPFGGPSAVASVERITRILTNPEPRARPSSVPAASGVAIAPANAASSPQLAAGWSEAPAAPVPALAPSREHSSGLGPISASASVVEVEPSHPRPRRWLATSAVLLALGGGSAAVLAWFAAPRSGPIGRSVAPLQSPAPGARPAMPVPGPAAESKAGPHESKAAPPSKPSASKASLSEERHERRPRSRAKPTISVEGFRAAVGSMKVSKKPAPRRSKSPQRSTRKEPAAPAKAEDVARLEAPPEPPAPVRASEPADDPWDPESFGGRR